MAIYKSIIINIIKESDNVWRKKYIALTLQSRLLYKVSDWTKFPWDLNKLVHINASTNTIIYAEKNNNGGFLYFTSQHY